jgi:hypothetical protein
MPVAKGSALCYARDGRWRRVPPIQSDGRPGTEGPTGFIIVEVKQAIASGLSFQDLA